ncbi:MAG: hypothetical protein IT320_14025 [Anaerolineae bacterium]|nr:hypothetical protein [Anaerolineae bacterium]
MPIRRFLSPDSDFAASAERQHYKPFTVTFETGDQALAVRVPLYGDPESILGVLDLKPGPIIFIMGGAGLMEDDALEDTKKLIEDGLVRFADERQITVIDGGTDSGVMAQIGAAREQAGAAFPLIGVAPESQVSYPGSGGGERAAHLDSSHTHFVLTDGDEFGDESHTIAMLATAISLDRRNSALGIVINGGQVVRHEVYMRSASGQMVFPILVLEGSGRFADELAEAKRTGTLPEDSEEEFAAILAADVDFFPISQGAAAFRERLAHYFEA